MSELVPNSDSKVLPFPSSVVLRSEIIPFAGGELEALRGGASGYLSIKSACETLGIDPQAQQRRLERSPWASTAMMAVVAADGKHRDMFCLRIEKVGMWLATIETSRIADPAARAKIELWQCEASDVLDRWWRGAAFVRPVEVSPNLARLQALHQELTGHRVELDMIGSTLQAIADKQHETRRVLETKLDDLSDYTERLDLELHRDKPSDAQRKETVEAIARACGCRVSETEAVVLRVVAEKGPVLSLPFIRSCARKGSQVVHAALKSAEDRGLLEVTQRAEWHTSARNFYVKADALQGHADGCQKFALESLGKMIEATGEPEMVGQYGHVPPGAIELHMNGAAVHVVPPRVQPAQINMQDTESPSLVTERNLLVKHIGAYGVQRGWGDEDYHRAYNRIYANLATLGMECRGKRDKNGKKIRPLDVVEARGWCSHALRIAREIYPLQAVA